MADPKSIVQEKIKESKVVTVQDLAKLEMVDTVELKKAPAKKTKTAESEAKAK